MDESMAGAQTKWAAWGAERGMGERGVNPNCAAQWGRVGWAGWGGREQNSPGWRGYPTGWWETAGVPRSNTHGAPPPILPMYDTLAGVNSALSLLPPLSGVGQDSTPSLPPSCPPLLVAAAAPTCKGWPPPPAGRTRAIVLTHLDAAIVQEVELDVTSSPEQLPPLLRVRK